MNYFEALMLLAAGLMAFSILWDAAIRRRERADTSKKETGGGSK